MTDLILIATILALLALARLYVRACEAIAPDEELRESRDGSEAPAARTPEPSPPARVPALLPLPLLATAGPGTGDWVGLGLAILLLGYLLFSLLAPERFR